MKKVRIASQKSTLLVSVVAPETREVCRKRPVARVVVHFIFVCACAARIESAIQPPHNCESKLHHGIA